MEEQIECTPYKHICNLNLEIRHCRRQFYNILCERSITKSIVFGGCRSNKPCTESEHVLIAEWIALENNIINEPSSYLLINAAMELDVSITTIKNIISGYKDIYENCNITRGQHCICGETSILYYAINRYTHEIVAVGSTCVKTIGMFSVSGYNCIQCGNRTKKSIYRFGRCADCIKNPIFVHGPNSRESILTTALNTDSINNCIDDDKALFDICKHLGKQLLSSILNTNVSRILSIDSQNTISDNDAYEFVHDMGIVKWYTNITNGVRSISKFYVEWKK